jgi:phytoene/squalene synthetase
MRTAGPAGLLPPVGQPGRPLLLHLHGIGDRDALAQSDAICSALQLINFWQDLSVDLPRGRCYLTDEDLARHGIDTDRLPATDTPATQALVAELCAWARAMMLSGAPWSTACPVGPAGNCARWCRAGCAFWRKSPPCSIAA